MSTAPDIALQLVPVTPAVAALIHQLQQELAEAHSTPEPGSAVLAPAGTLRAASSCDARYHAAYDEDYRSSIYLHRSTHRPGGIWTGEETRRDEQRRCWVRRIEAITDDFGNLVEVA